MPKRFIEGLEIGNLSQAEHLLKDSLEGFFNLFNNAPVSMSITIPGKRKFFAANPKFLEKFGYAEHELLGKNSLELEIIPEESFLKIGDGLSVNGFIENEFLTCFHRDGTPIHTVISFKPINLLNKDYILASFLDVTAMVEKQKIIEQQHKEIMDSISYARIIQNSIFPTQAQIDRQFAANFILNYPKNIIGGDFFWLRKNAEKVYFALADCTGHGVPAAMISMLAFKLLNRFVREYKLESPNEFINQLNSEFKINTPDFGDSPEEIFDGLEIFLGCINKVSLRLEYAGASRPAFVVRKNELTVLRTDKKHVNLFTTSLDGEFSNYSFQLEPGDRIYLFSDGIVDQFGGPRDKKFGYIRFETLILEIQDHPLSVQKTILQREFLQWKAQGNNEQTDDVFVVALEV